MSVEKVGVIGLGLMGSGIAQVAAAAGFETLVREVDAERLDMGMAAIDDFLSKGVERGKLDEARKRSVLALVERGKLDEARKRTILSLIEPTTELSAFGACDIVIEAVTEDIEIKKDIFRALDNVVSDEALRCSNTSSLSVTEMAAASRRPNRFAGLHFFSPVPLMKVVEIVPTVMTDGDVVGALSGFARRLGKTPVTAPDRPGFIVNRLLVPYLLDAIRALEDGTASREDIDAGMKLGCGHPMGPLELLDFVGLDTTYYIANIMYEEFRERRFAPPPLLRRMVMAGRLGRKTGKGFYDYS